MPKKYILPLYNIGLVAGGMCLFAFFAHYRNWQIFLSISGLVLSGFGIFNFILTYPSLAIETFGLSPVSKKILTFILLGSAIGLGFGIAYRVYCLEETAFPSHFTWFLPLACLIGATEEFVYRGFVQGALRRVGPLMAIILTSLFHTAYKCSLFMTPHMQPEINLAFLFTATFLVGLILGSLREFSGNLLPSIALHIFFDLVVYGGYYQAPWWVWS
jgi:membrane protease YdiL (CAAX protease family)